MQKNKQFSADSCKVRGETSLAIRRTVRGEKKQKKGQIELVSAASSRTNLSYKFQIEKMGQNKFVPKPFSHLCPTQPLISPGTLPTKPLASGNPSRIAPGALQLTSELYKQKIQYNHNLHKEEIMAEEQFECESMDSNHSVQFEYLTTKIYEQLVTSHQLAKDFINELGPLQETPIISSLTNYCKDMNLGAKSAQAILDLMEGRLNKMIKNNRLKKNWSYEDLEILVWLLSKYMQKRAIQSHQDLTKHDWNSIAAMIPGATSRNCMFKFVSLKKFKLAHHKWQKEEENLLLRIIQQIGTNNWKLIAEKLYDQSQKKRIFRTPKQCREHWSCYLDPKIKKGPWQKEEDRKLLQIVLDSNCQKRWSAIKLQFEGRTENALKNRYNLLLQKQKKLNADQAQSDLIHEILKKIIQQEQNQQKTEAGNGSAKREGSFSNIPLIPEERRNLTIPFHPGVIIFFSGGSYQL